MKPARRVATIALGWVLALALTPSGFGQTPASTHVFAFAADGGADTGFLYRTRFVVTPFLQPATCTLSVFEIQADRITETGLTLEADRPGSLATTGTAGELQTGYARIDCSAPVSAHAILERRDAASGLPSATATISPHATSFNLWITGVTSERCRCRLALSVANDTGVERDYRIVGPGETVTRTLAAHSSEAFFADEVMDIAPGSELTVLAIQDLGTDVEAVDVMALQFVGDAFAAAPARNVR